MRRLAALLVLLFSCAMRPALATDHYVFGLKESDGYQVTFPDATRDTLAQPDGQSGILFESLQRGRFEIIPVGTVPPAACPDLSIVDVQVGGVALCGTGPWMGRYKVRNVGTADAPASVTGLSFTPPGGTATILPNQSCPALPPGGTSQEFAFQILPTIPANAAQYLVAICANKPGSFPEGPAPNCY